MEEACDVYPCMGVGQNCGQLYVGNHCICSAFYMVQGSFSARAVLALACWDFPEENRNRHQRRPSQSVEV
jgi:hypothetical protein